MSVFFLSYRVSTASAQAGRLFDRLALRFGPELIFFDKGRLDPGELWEARLESELNQTGIVLAIIDDGWASAFSERAGTKYYVRLELETVLQLGKPILPILVAGCPLPSPQELPESIRPILDYQAWRLDDSTVDSYSSSATRLLTCLEQMEAVFDFLEDQAISLLLEQRYSLALHAAKKIPANPNLISRRLCFIALARLAGRAFNALHPNERVSIENLIRESCIGDPEWALPRALLEIIEIDFYKLNGMRGSSAASLKSDERFRKWSLSSLESRIISNIQLTRNATAHLARFSGG